MTEHDRRRLVAGVLVLALVAAVLAWWLWPEPDEPLPAAVPQPSPTVPVPVRQSAGPCDHQARRPFVPIEASLAGVVRRAKVLALPRDAAGVVGVPPVSDKDVFAWDLGGVRAAGARGHVLLNAHTWPDGSALGNAMLRAFDRGDRLVLRGRGGATACYQVVRRVEVRAEDGYPGWDRADGSPRVVIVVCSGARLGPGQWTHRTLWFARPVGPTPPVR